MVATAEDEADAFLSGVAAPLCKTVIAALKAEGFEFRLSTPPDAVRISRATSGDDYIELALDATRTRPAMMGRVSRTWGRRVLADEQVVAEHPAIGKLDEATVLEFVVRALGAARRTVNAGVGSSGVGSRSLIRERATPPPSILVAASSAALATIASSATPPARSRSSTATSSPRTTGGADQSRELSCRGTTPRSTPTQSSNPTRAPNSAARLSPRLLVPCISDSHHKSAGMRGDGAVGESGDARQDVVGRLGPDQGLRVCIVDVKKLADGALQGRHTAVRAAAQLFVRQCGEPALDEVEPRTRRSGVKCKWKRGRLVNHR